MKIHLLVVLFFFIVPLVSSAQREADHWYFGDHVGLSFQNGSPVPITNGQLITQEVCAVMSDRVTGKLLFYTDGSTIWNASHKVVNNGTELKGGSSSSQGALIVPNPANVMEYYIFTVPDLTAGDQPKSTGMYYSLISVVNPNCEVIEKNKLLVEGVSEKLTGTLDCTESGYWVVAHDVSYNTLYSFHITGNGVDTKPVISGYDEEPIDHIQGCMKFSPNGKKLAVASTLRKKLPFLALFDFDRRTGMITNYTLLSNPNSSERFYGLSFSPNSSILFAIGKTNLGLPMYYTALFQYDMNLTNASDIPSSEYMTLVRTQIPFNNSGLQLAPDGKLYIVSGNRKNLDVINKPNLRGIACEYQENVISFSNDCGRNLPNFMDYIFGNHCLYSNCNLEGDTITICKGTGIKIGVQSLVGVTYSWTPTEGLDNPSISSPIASPNKTTSYRLKVISPSCEGYLTYVVKIAEKPMIDPVGPLCEGSSVQLSTSGGSSYLWSPAEDLDTATKANPIARPKVNTLYKVVVTQGYCTDSAFVMVNVFPRVTASAGVDKTICLYESVQIGDTAKPDETYTWIPPTGLDDTTIPNPIATPKGTTKYIVEAKRNGCTAYDTVVVTVALVKPEVSKDVTICKGTSVQLTSGGGRAYSWTPYTGLSNPRVQNPMASPTETTKYRVIISNGKCIDSAFVTVTVTPAPKANAGTDKAICSGSSTQIGMSAEVGNTYSWMPVTNLDNPKKADPTCSPVKTTQYILTVTNPSGCKAYDTVIVSMKSIVANAGADKTVCTGASTHIGTPPETGIAYSWLPTDNLDDPTKANPTATPSSTTRYILTVTDTEGCIGYDTVLVTVSNTLTANISGDTAFCKGSSIQLLAGGGSEYLWSPADGLDNLSIPNPIATPDATTTYTVRVSSGKCEDSAKVTVTIHPSPIADAGPDKSPCKDETTKLGVPPLDGNTYGWQPTEGIDNPTISNPSVNPIGTTEYVLTVTNAAGCITRDNVLVTIATIKAVASIDTSICTGSSVKLTASGGNNYVWSPSIGLDNPNIATPTATPDTTTLYTVLVSNGDCIDTASVMVSVIPTPIAYAGKDTSICTDESALIGSLSISGNSYSWNPTAGLVNPNESQTTARPTVKTSYILTVTNPSGCVSNDTVIVDVNASDERIFIINPPIVTITPGQPFKTMLSIPQGVQSWNVRLHYDDLVIKYDTILQTSNDVMIDSVHEQKGQLLLRGVGENGNVTIQFNTFLPYSFDTTFSIGLTVESTEKELCTNLITQGNIIQIGEYCAKIMRSVSSTGKNYFLSTKASGISFGVGISGKVRLELYDYTGILKQVIMDGVMEAGEYSVDIAMPVGVYFCRMNAGMFHDSQKIMVLENR